MSDNIVLMGRAIGTAHGWDQQDNFAMILYDFVPAVGVSLPRGDVTFDFESGLATLCSDSGTLLETVDIIAALSDLPQVNL